jgi:type VI secretion system protein ImpL
MKQYKGPQAFVDFLRDFPGGRHTFQTDEFPQEKNELRKAGIKFIEVNYQISGEQAILKNFEPLSSGQARSRSVRNITACWD